MILNIDRLLKIITNYILSEIKTANKNGVIIPVSGGLNSTVAAVLCKQANIPFYAFHIRHDDSILETCKNILNGINIAVFANVEDENNDIGNSNHDSLELFRGGVLSAYCGAYASYHNYLIIGDLCRSKSNLVRRYTKRHGDTADIYPFADLYRSEMVQIAKYFLSKDIEFCGASELHSKNITHEDRLHLTFPDIEWADTEHSKNNILSVEPLNSAQYWYKYTLGQKEVLSRIQQIEKRTRHKKLLKPILHLRDKEGLFQ